MLNPSGERVITDQEYIDTLPATVKSVRACFDSRKTRPESWRRAQLELLLAILSDHREEICGALKQDMGRDNFSSFITETAQIEVEIAYALKHLHSWMKPESLSLGVANKPGSAHLLPEPYGVVLIMAAWNFPVLTLLQPAVGAIAAGNCVILKPASLAGNTSIVLARLLRQHMDTDAIRVVEGGVETASVLLKERFDKIMYTGSSRIGKVVARAAAEYLTPVDLELGGKNPCILTQNVKSIKVAADRIAWAKFAVNTGQVCIAPDYIMVHESIADSFVAAILESIKQFFGKDPKTCENYCRIINHVHVNRLKSILESDKQFLVYGGVLESDTKYIMPSILDFKNDMHAFANSAAMKDEIFGPILPIVVFKESIEECINFINGNDKPLSLYVFGSKKDGELLADRTSSGSVTLNDCIMQKAEMSIPFGGIGMSGSGRYTGKYSFETFSHYKPVLLKGLKFDLDARYPPYTDKKKTLFKVLHEVSTGSKGMFALGMGMLKYKN